MMHLHVFPTQLVDTRSPRPQYPTLTTLLTRVLTITIDGLNEVLIPVKVAMAEFSWMTIEH